MHFPFPISSQTPTQELLPRLRCIWIFEFHEAITLKQNLVIYSGQGKEESESCKYLLCFVSACSSTFSLLSCTQIGFFPFRKRAPPEQANKTFRHVENINKYLHSQIACTWNNDCLIVSSLLITHVTQSFPHLALLVPRRSLFTAIFGLWRAIISCSHLLPPSVSARDFTKLSSLMGSCESFRC